MSIRRYDVQARYAMMLSLVSVLPCLVAIAGIVRNYDRPLGKIVYGETSLFMPFLMAAIGSATLLSVIGLFLGFNSAGQRRNDQQAKSWVGFFVGGTVFTLCLAMLFAFVRLRYPME